MRNPFRSLSQEDINKDERYREARSFTETFNPGDNKSYAWIYEHAMQVFRDANKRVDAYDAKAENMIRYTAPGSGLLGIAVVWFASQTDQSGSTLIPVLIGVGIILVICATISALLSLIDHQQSLPPKVKEAIECMDYYKTKDQGLAALASGVQSSIAVKQIVVEVKATYHKWATRFYIAGLMLIIVGIFLSVSRLL